MSGRGKCAALHISGSIHHICFCALRLGHFVLHLGFPECRYGVEVVQTQYTVIALTVRFGAGKSDEWL